MKAAVLRENHCTWLAEAITEPYCVCDLDGAIKAANDAARKFLGCDDEAPLVSSLADFFASKEEWHHFIKVLLKKGEVSRQGVRLRRKDSTPMESMVSAALLSGGDGQPTGFQAVIMGVREPLWFRQQMSHMEKMGALGQLTGSVAHEINNPLNIILGYTQLLLRESKPGSEVWENLKEIEECTQACRKVVGELLEFSQSRTAGKQTVDLNQILTQVLNILDHLLETERITLVKNLDPNLPAIVGDPDRLKQVFMNILMNAKQAINTDGTITVRTGYLLKKETALVSIQDTGPAIPPELRDRIFEPFFTTKAAGEGTGLGLTVSKGIVAEHGGHIEVESASGMGSTFIITLPQRPVLTNP